MKIRAIESFGGALSLIKGEVIDCEEEYIVNDLLQAGYIEMIEKPTRRGVKKSANKSD